ncbi:hypothetical protein Tco_0063781, partial [Tanacetum coccineum]
MALHLLHQFEDPATMIRLSKTAVGVANEIVMLKKVPKTPLQFGVAERLSRTFRVESTRLRVEAPKMLWADSVSTAYLIYHIPYVSTGLRILEEEWLFEAEISHLWSQFMDPENLADNDSIVAEHGLSLEITQNPGGSLDTSKGSKNSKSFEDSGRSGEEYSKDEASSNEGGSETPHVQRSTRESRAPVRFPPSINYLLLTKNGEPESYLEALNS